MNPMRLFVGALITLTLVPGFASGQTAAASNRDPWTSPAMIRRDGELTEDDRVAGLSKLWAEVKFNFVNFALVPELDWDAEYMRYLPRVRQAKSTYEYYRLLAEMCAKLHDGHTYITPPAAVAQEDYARPLLRTRLVEDRVFISEVWDAELRHGIVPPAEVVAIDGVPVREYAETRVQPYQSGSTAHGLAINTYEMFLLAGPRQRPVELTIRQGNGRDVKVSAKRHTREERMKLAPLVQAFEFKLLPGNVAYVALNGFETEATTERYLAEFDNISKANALIIDFRNNRGGYSEFGWRIFASLIDKPFLSTRWRTQNYNARDSRKWGKEREWIGPEPRTFKPDPERHFGGPVVLLTGANTFSAAEDVASTFDETRRGTIIGEPTGGSTGESMSVPLPGGGAAHICVVRDTYADGREFVGKGVQPHKVVRQTVADYLAGRDTVLDTALEYVRAQVSTTKNDPAGN